MMFYNDDEEGSYKKTEKDTIENYEDKIKDLDENETNATSKSINLRKFISSKVDARDYEEQEESENSTSSTAKASHIEIVTKMTMKERLRDKRRPICSMLKLRQLNFNSPRTLPEVSHHILFLST